MFNLLNRNLTFSVLKSKSIHGLFRRSLSSTLSASDLKINNSFAVSYLIDSCGFSPDKAISASKFFNFKTPNLPDSVISFFKNQGFTDSQIFHFLQKYPIVLNFNPEKNLLPKFDFLKSIGLSGSEIVKLLVASPQSLGKSLKKDIEPNFKLLKDLLQSNDRTLIAIKRCAWILDSSTQRNMVPNMEYLRDIGVPGSKVLYALSNQPRVLDVSTKLFKEAVERVLEMGFDRCTTKFMLGVQAVRSMSKSTWEKKIEAYEKWGLTKDEILAAFRNDPWCMMKSEEKIDTVMDFLVNKMGLETSVIAKNTVILSLSMEKRIIPRCLVYQYVLDNGMMKMEKKLSFSWWLKCPETLFIKRLKRYEKETPSVLEFYQEKLGFSK